MPRYKDIDAILNNLPDDLPYKASVKRVLIQAPTADVVPKSDYEYLKKLLDDKCDCCIEEEKERVARVAMEIFEEIDGNMVNANFITGNVELNFAYYLELKKKYTESEGE